MGDGPRILIVAATAARAPRCAWEGCSDLATRPALAPPATRPVTVFAARGDAGDIFAPGTDGKGEPDRMPG